MKNLKSKTFILLVSIFSVFLLVGMIAYNVSLYHSEESRLVDNIMRMENVDNRNNKFPKDNKSPMFIGLDAYKVSFDSYGDIQNIKNYTDNEISKDEISNIIRNLNINKIKDTKDGFTGNLYFDKYVFSTNREGNLLIVKNDITRNNLDMALISSIIIILLLECFIVIISKLLTNWLAEPVEESFEKQKNFIYDASHELKTPIAVILASAESLEKSPKEKKYLNNIKSETERMDNLVKKLLELSRTEKIHNNDLSIENLSKIVENRSLTFESLAFEQDINIESEITKDILYKCDSEQIKEVVNILVDNAIKHSEKKSTIKIKLYKEKNNIILDVINKGKEIPISEREKIFDRFYRGDKSRNRKENRYGLGLAIAKNIIENYNGKISVNCKNGYTTFTIKL